MPSPEVNQSGSRKRRNRGLSNLSIVIPVLNEPALPNFLSSLANTMRTGNLRTEIETIIVDGGSTDGTREIAENYRNLIPNLRVITTEKGVGHQRNIGASQATHEHILFLDGDVTLSPKSLKRITEKVVSTERVVNWILLIPDKSSRTRDYVGTMVQELVRFSLHKIVPLVGGGAILTTQENHAAVGGFNEGIGEGFDYARRSVKDGAKHHILLRSAMRVSMRRQQKTGWISHFGDLTKILVQNMRGQGTIAENNINYPMGEWKDPNEN
jgi:glycosyltransferase involved in cell wall biosynthesis